MTEEIDTLTLLTEKLSDLFNQSQNYYETFLDSNTLYKDGRIDDVDFFKKLGDYVVAYSALEFLSIKVILEIKKSLDQLSNKLITGNSNIGNNTGVHNTNVRNISNMPPSIFSERSKSIGTLPSPDPRLITHNEDKKCSLCNNMLKLNAKFCTKCGNKV